jgi:HTH-type transcriptional regulator / antitoxin HigA
MEPRIIKTEADYNAFLSEVERLARDDPMPGTAEADRLELLAKLVEDYEKARFPFEKPDPISAIRFRMEQAGMRQKDLADLLGGKNRASEVLSGKRPLTVQMIRALNERLGIPTDLLIGQSLPAAIEHEHLAAEQVPISYLVRTGWLPSTTVTDGAARSALITRYLAPAHGPLYLRRTITYGSTPETNKTNLKLWVSRIRELAEETRKHRGAWRPEAFDEDFLVYVARLSWADEGPKIAQKFLGEKGIALVIWPSLPNTRLDGAAMRDAAGAPIIGMTLRFDRLDNFWFTLMHELVHAWKHLKEPDIAITDERLEEERDDDDAKEAEANRLARDILIPRTIWKRSDAYLYPSEQTICALADTLHISPAIVAGRLRREKTGYQRLNKLVGTKKVRRLFPQIKWDTAK